MKLSIFIVNIMFKIFMISVDDFVSHVWKRKLLSDFDWTIHNSKFASIFIWGHPYITYAKNARFWPPSLPLLHSVHFHIPPLCVRTHESRPPPPPNYWGTIWVNVIFVESSGKLLDFWYYNKLFPSHVDQFSCQASRGRVWVCLFRRSYYKSSLEVCSVRLVYSVREVWMWGMQALPESVYQKTARSAVA